MPPALTSLQFMTSTTATAGVLRTGCRTHRCTAAMSTRRLPSLAILGLDRLHSLDRRRSTIIGQAAAAAVVVALVAVVVAEVVLTAASS